MPDYLSKVTLDTSTENFYWNSRLIDVLADAFYGSAIQDIERYKQMISVEGRKIIREYDEKIAGVHEEKLIAEANDKLCAMAKKQTQNTLNKLVLTGSKGMKNNYARSDN